MDIGHGHVVEFIEGQRFVCAACVGQKGSRYHLITHLGREVNLARGRFLHISSRAIKAATRHEQLVALQEINDRREALKADLALQELWELVNEEGVTWGVRSLAELAFEGEIGPDHEAALIRAVIEDGPYFKFTDGAILCNTPESVERIRQQRAAEAQRLRRLSAGSYWLRGLWGMEEASSADISDDDKAYWLEAIREFCLFGDEAKEAQMVSSLFRQAGLNESSAPFHTLVRAGVWEEDENLELLRYDLSQEFPPEVMAQALEIAQEPLDRDGRDDLTHLDIWTIDAEESQDLDDALSFREVEEGWEIGVHITDIGLLLPPGTPLFGEAIKRASTIYMPDSRVPMLPRELSEDALSLLPGRLRRAISFMAVVDREGNILKSDIRRSVIRVSKRLSYSEVDGLIREDGSDFALLHSILKAMEQKRIQQGALPLPVPELVIRIGETGDIEVQLETPGPARFLVAEAMIMANYLAALFLRDRNIPGLFRSQPEPRERLVNGLDDDLVLYLRQRRRISRGVLDTVPGLHSGLGLDAYTTVTSPLRRGLDLLMQQQIASFLATGQPMHSLESLDELSPILKEGLRVATDVRYKRHRYWLLKYLEGRKGDVFKAWVIEGGESKLLAALQDFMITVEVARPRGQKYQLDEEVNLILKKVDARENILQFVIET